MAKITREDAARIAALARLEMNAGELDRAARDLESILGHFEIISRIDTAGIDAAAPLAAGSSLRADSPFPSLESDDVFANAVDADPAAGLFRVPRVLGS